MGVCFPSITVTPAPHSPTLPILLADTHAHTQGCKHDHKQNAIQNQICTLLGCAEGFANMRRSRQGRVSGGVEVGVTVAH